MVYLCDAEAGVDKTLLVGVAAEEGNGAAAVKDHETRLEVHGRVLAKETTVSAD